MKRRYFLNLIVIFIIIVSLSFFAKAICDDEDTLLNAPPHEGYPDYAVLLSSPLSQSGTLFESQNNGLFLRQISSYLERHEKSPPFGPIISVTA